MIISGFENLYLCINYINKRMELSLIQIGKSDSYYNEVMEAIVESSKAYESLELDVESKEVIERLLHDRDIAEIEQASLAYLAGFRDCVLILSKLELFDF